MFCPPLHHCRFMDNIFWIKWMTCALVVSFCLYICSIKEQPDSVDMKTMLQLKNMNVWAYVLGFTLVVLKHISTDCGIDPQTGVQHHCKHKVFWPSIRSEWEVIILNNFNWVVKIWGNKPASSFIFSPLFSLN